MNNKRKAFALIILFVVVLFLNSCSIKKIDFDTATQPSQTTIHIHCFDSGIKNRLEVATSAYSNQNIDTKFFLKSAKSDSSNLSSLQKHFNSDDEPVLFNITSLNELNALKPYLYDFSDFELLSKTTNNLNENVTQNGSIYGLPMCLEGYGIIYNKDILNSAKINPEDITDIKTLKSATEQIYIKIKNNELKEKFPNLSCVFSPLNYDKSGNLLKLYINEYSSYSSPKVLSTTKYLQINQDNSFTDFINLSKTYSSNIILSGTLTDAEMLANEKAVFSISSSRIINSIKEINTDISSKFAFLPVFGGNIIVGAPAYWAINKNASQDKISSALKFLQWLYTSDEGKLITIDSLFFVPAYRGYENITQSEAINRSVSEYINREHTIPLVTLGLPTEMSTSYFNSLMKRFLSGQSSWKEVISTVKKDFIRLRATIND